MEILVRAPLVVLLGFMTFLSVRSALEDIYFSDYVSYGKNADPRATVEFSGEKNAAMLGSCRTDIFGPGLRMQILRLNQSSASEDYDSWFHAIGDTESYLKRAIRCAPYRGDSWVRSGLVSQEIAEEPQQLSQIMKYALILGPGDRNQIMARMTVWSRASSQLQTLNKPEIARDIDTILRYGDESTIKRLLNEKSTLLQDILASSLQELPATRKKSIKDIDIK